jgi:hypothetical protein
VPILIGVEKPRRWTRRDWKSLPNLRRPQHDTDDLGGWEKHPLLLRCEHGVYLTSDPDLGWSGAGGPDDDNILDIWSAPYCENCHAKYAADSAEFGKIRLSQGRLFSNRPLEPGEYRNRQGKLFDGLPVYPETFTRAVKLRGRTMTDDLRLQEDYETGKPRLETMGGYIAAAFGYSKAGRGHGPDSDADDIRLAWMANHEGTAIVADHDKAKHTPWTATLPAVDRGITDENWFPLCLPVGVAKPEGGVHHGFLKEGDTFANERNQRVLPQVFKWQKNSAARVRFQQFYRYIPFKKIEQRDSASAADNLRWHARARLARREDRWRMWDVQEPLPSKKQLAQWKRKREYQRGGGANLVPGRRTKRWADDWRTDRKIQDLEAGLNMYHYRVDITETRKVNVARMLSTANRSRWSAFLLRYLEGARVLGRPVYFRR